MSDLVASLQREKWRQHLPFKDVLSKDDYGA